MNPEPLLVARSVAKDFGGLAALRDASLTVRAGEVHALVGQNGAGKSTLIKVLSGAYRRSGGTIAFGGIPVDFASPPDAQRAGIATIHQEIVLVGLRSVAENIALGREPTRWGMLDRRAMRAQAIALLARFGLAIDVDRPLGSYTIAVQQLIAIARALGGAARLVIMDEPTSSLDEHEAATLFAVIRQVRAQGVGVIFISHRLDELYAVCDQVTVLRDGCTVHAGALHEIERIALVASMLGRRVEDVARSGRTAFAHGVHGAVGVDSARGAEDAQGGPDAHRREGADEPAAAGPGSAARSESAPLLRVRALAGGPRLRGVDVEVRSGEIVGLGGLLGSGRTETARAVFGADRVPSGTVQLAGGAARPVNPRAAMAAGLGFCPEDRKADGVVPDLPVRENLTLALLPRLARLGVVDRAAQARVVDRFIERMQIRCSGPEQPIRELSGGNQQKVLLARWMCTDPRLLILDEPTRGIDVGAKAEVQRQIGELAAGGLGVLMISSELEELVEGCDRVAVLRDGRSVGELAGASLTEMNIMAAMASGAATPATAPPGTPHG